MNLSKVQKRLVVCCLIFLTALGVRYLTWQDQRFDAWKTQENVAKDYRHQANFIREDGVLSLIDSNAKATDINFMLHPPGYPIILAAAFDLFGDADDTIQWLSIIIDCVSATIIFLIVLEILGLGVATLTGLLAAFSPQFASNCILLLPDILSILPLLLAAYILIKTYQKPNLWLALLSGVCIGISCWIRANAMLMAPFLAVLLLFLLPSKRLSFGGSLILGAVLVIAPLTIRNWVVYQAFIPISLGTGQILLEGIGDYDTDKRFGMPKYDWEVTQQEAEIYNRPEYAGGLVHVDGIKRDRQRTMRGLKFIAENPVWFASVMIRRAAWMLQPEKAQIVTLQIPVSRPIQNAEETVPTSVYRATELNEGSSLLSPEAIIAVSPSVLNLKTDNQKYGLQYLSPGLTTMPNKEYVLRLKLVLRSGRVRISVRNAGSANNLSSTVVDPDPIASSESQPERIIAVPFVSGNSTAIQFTVANEAPQTFPSILEIQQAEVHELGIARNNWTLPLRYFVSPLQRIFSLPVLLPLELIGLGILLWRREWKSALLLLLIPLYYFCVQSALHTEYRYILIIHYFLFAFAAATVFVFLSWIIRKTNLFQHETI